MGVILVTVRAPGRPDFGARLLRTSYVLPVLLAFALVQIPLAFLVEALGEELIWVVLGSMIGLGLGGLVGCVVGLLMAGGILGWTEAPPGAGFAGRSAFAVCLAATIVMASR